MHDPDFNLPFFAYGLFKPGQLSFHKIHDLVKSYEEDQILGYLKERDGVPILVKSEYSNVSGFLIKFKSETAIDAYHRIELSEPDKYYRWIKTHTLRNIKCNVLLGKSPNKGTSNYERGIWDGKKDPYFDDALIFIKSVIEDENIHLEGPMNAEPFFRLQMAYMLLWTSIERYSSLRYNLNENPNKRIMHIADEKIFSESLKKHFLNDKFQRKLKIVRADNPNNVCKLDPEKPKKSLEYYYQVRSNSVHMGKTIFYDYYTIRAALIELFAIFSDIINYSFEIEPENLKNNEI